MYENEYFSMRFKSLEFPKDKLYGLNYDFYLEDAVGNKSKDDKEGEEKDSNISYVPEYIVEIKNL